MRQAPVLISQQEYTHAHVYTHLKAEIMLSKITKTQNDNKNRNNNTYPPFLYKKPSFVLGTWIIRVRRKFFQLSPEHMCYCNLKGKKQHEMTNDMPIFLYELEYIGDDLIRM